MAARPHILIVGAGLAGLNCARGLAAAGCTFELVEAAGRAGGRVATDSLDGFQLDRGFQVLTDARCEELVREQLSQWFGPEVRGWRHLRTCRVAHALPEQASVTLCTHARARRARRGVYVCGDHLDTASINGALRAGRVASEAVVEDLLGAEGGARVA